MQTLERIGAQYFAYVANERGNQVARATWFNSKKNNNMKITGWKYRLLVAAGIVICCLVILVIVFFTKNAL